jgi:hypothetical protein
MTVPRLIAIVTAVLLACALAGCSFTSTTGPTNEGPFSQLVQVDIPAAGITVLEAAGGPSEVAKKGELYIRVLAAEGQDARAIADRLLSLTQKYKEQLHLHWLHVVIASSEGFYDHTYDLTSNTASTT